MKRPIAVVGGGLAGIAAAIRLADAGVAPIVIESKKRLGGRATSFQDPRSGMLIDNCQHVLMGCCTNLLDCYDRLGVLDRIRWEQTQYFTRGDGVVDALAPGRAPAPFHLAGAMRRMKLYTRSDKRAIAKGMWRLIRLGGPGRLQWRGRPFREFLDTWGQPSGVIADFWNTVIVSACNLDVDTVDAQVAMQVFQEGFLASRWSCAMGVPDQPLSTLYDPAEDYLQQRGGKIRLGVSAKGLAYDGKRVSGVVTTDGLVEAAAVVCALPFDRLDKLLTATLRAADRRLDRLGELRCSPILGVHLLFDHPIMDHPHLTLVACDVHWLFNKGSDEQGRQHVHAVISAADDWMEMDEPRIVDRVMADVHRVLPRSVGLRPVHARSIKERRATFAAVPGIEQLRPSAAPGPIGVGGGGVPNLFLAGDWCDTGWPATMEGAVRSGYAAAAAITGKGGVVEDVPAGALARVLGLR